MKWPLFLLAVGAHAFKPVPSFKHTTATVTGKVKMFDGDFTNTLNEVTTLKADILDRVLPYLTPFQDAIHSAIVQVPHISRNQNQNDLLKVVSEISGFAADGPEVSFLFAQGIFITLAVVFAPLLLTILQTDVGFETPYEVGSTTYDVKKADDFYDARPKLVFSRLLQLAALTGNFNIKLLMDWRFGNLEANEKERAKEALALSTMLGPTFIKLGQALSIRTDLIPEAYALELRQLQDAVPPFDDAMAKEILRKELGVNDLRKVFKSLTTVSIASASIGQVYRGTLVDGRDVAVKVQRPKILGEIALDLYLLRLLTPLQVKVSNWINKRGTEQEDIDTALALVDEWGRGFVAEVDYRTEAKNTVEFSAAMQRRGLDAVVAPEVVDEYSGKRVIVTEWIEGTRLDRDASPDVPRLCAVAVNAYLTMLLDTGVLHCDPHPGNLLRTLDGRLCVLDWGMTLGVPSDLQYGLLEFIAHVISEDYESMPADFINLGFSPADKLDRLESSGLTEGLAFALRQLKRGGGPKKIQERVKEEFKDRYGNDLSDEELRQAARDDMIQQMQSQLKKEGVDVNDVTGVMEEMSRRNRELFKLPPYVLYVSRAFSTLEGIGLSIDEDYSILSECYPYLAKRLLTDDSPRAQEALRTMLYGAGELSSSIQPDTLLEMGEGFATYTSSTGSADEGTGSALAQRELAELILSSEGNFIQSTILDEASKLVDASIRDSYVSAKESQIGKLAQQVFDTQTQFANQVAAVPFVGKALATPAMIPVEIASSVNRLLEKDEEDEASLKLAETLFAQLQERQTPSIPTSSSSSLSGTVNGSLQPSSSLSTVPSVEQIRDWITDENSLLRKALADESLRTSILPKVGTISAKFGAKLINRASTRIEGKLHGMQDESELDNGGLIVRSIAERGAELGKTVASLIDPMSKEKVAVE